MKGGSAFNHFRSEHALLVGGHRRGLREKISPLL